MDMIERVAGAMAKSDGYIGLMSMPRGKRDTYFARARAAIEALREPTAEMMNALRFYGMLDGDAEEAWEMTVKTALDPSTPLVGH